MSQSLNPRIDLIEALPGASGWSAVNIYRNHDGCLWAGKVLNKSTYPKWKNEVKILKEVGKDNKNVIHYISSDETNVSVTLFMQLCDSNVEEFVSNKEIVPHTKFENKLEFKPREYFNINPIKLCKQAVSGIHYLHTLSGIIHRDIKPSNFLLFRTSKGTTEVKVTDFGLSRPLPPGNAGVLTGSTGTEPYMAKECYNGYWDKSSDIFALGIVIFFVLSNGHHPFGEKDYNQKKRICEEKPPKLDHLRNGKLPFSREQAITACDLVKRMIKHDPNSRFTIENVLAHPTFWDSKRKIDFYKKIHIVLKDKRSKEMLELNTFDASLLNGNRDDRRKFDIRLEKVPEPIRNNKNFPVQKCNNIQDLVVLIRNQEAHACDKNQSKKIKNALGVEAHQLDPDALLEALTKDYPHLLVHLYEFYRGERFAKDFYVSETASQHGSPSSSGAVTQRPLLTVSASSEPHPVTPSPLECYLREQGIGADDVYKSTVAIKYYGATKQQTQMFLKINPLKICCPGDTAGNLEKKLEFPQGFTDTDIKGIMQHSTNGIAIRTDSKAKSIFARRNCKVHVFYNSHMQPEPEKMASNSEVLVLSYEKLVEQLEKGAEKNLKSTIEFFFGKDPSKTSYERLPVSVVFESLAAASLIAQHEMSISGESSSILISK